MSMITHPMDADELKALCEAEKMPDEFEKIRAIQGAMKSRSLDSMETIEAFIVNHTIEQM